MSTDGLEIRVSGVAVQIVRKDIKNLHLGVYPPNGRVRVAAPLSVRDEAGRLGVVEHRGPARVVLRNRTFFELYVRRDTDAKGRERVLQNWYRAHLRRLIPP